MSLIPPDPDWRQLYTEQFASSRINLNPGTLGTPSRAVRNAMLEFYAQDRFAYPLGQYLEGRTALRAARDLAIQLFGLPEGAALSVTTGATSSMNTLAGLLARQLRPASGPPIRLLTTRHEHHGGLDAFSHDARYRLEYLPDTALWEDPGLIEALETFRPEVLLVSQRTWTGGQRLPVEHMGRLARHLLPEVWCLVDAAQALGLEPPAWQEADLVVSSAHKWLSGPPGTGLTWLSRRACEQLLPLVAKVEPLDPESPGAVIEPSGGQDFSRYAGLLAALTLFQAVGANTAGSRSRALAGQFAAQLDAACATAGKRIGFIPEQGLGLLEAPPLPQQTAGVLGVECLGFDPYPLYMALNARGVHTKCIKGPGLNRLRLGIPWYEQPERLTWAAEQVQRCLLEV